MRLEWQMEFSVRVLHRLKWLTTKLVKHSSVSTQNQRNSYLWWILNRRMKILARKQLELIKMYVFSVFNQLCQTSYYRAVEFQPFMPIFAIRMYRQNGWNFTDSTNMYKYLNWFQHTQASTPGNDMGLAVNVDDCLTPKILSLCSEKTVLIHMFVQNLLEDSENSKIGCLKVLNFSIYVNICT